MSGNPTLPGPGVQGCPTDMSESRRRASTGRAERQREWQRSRECESASREMQRMPPVVNLEARQFDNCAWRSHNKRARSGVPCPVLPCTVYWVVKEDREVRLLLQGMGLGDDLWGTHELRAGGPASCNKRAPGAASRRRNLRPKLLCGLMDASRGVPRLSTGNWPKAPPKTPNGNGVPCQNGRLAAPAQSQPMFAG
jgi:hypothetical protein